MHLISINHPELWLGLWRGTIACDAQDDVDAWDWAVLVDDVWLAHGAEVAAAARPHFPGSFDCPPRNPAEKLNSGYKAWESLMYLFGLGPGLLYGILAEKYWRHYCKLVQAARIIHQRRLPADQVNYAHDLILSFCEEFEQLYCQRKASRLHFVRQSIHALLHLAPESFRLGPFAIYAQWTMERTIGDLGRQIRQPSNPYANLARRALHQCQRNTLHALIPDLSPKTKPSLPRNAVPLGNSYILLHKAQKTPRLPPPDEAAAIREYFAEHCPEDISVSEDWLEHPKVAKCARLWLPNGQIARSDWIEASRPLDKLRIARNVKLDENGETGFAEVQYYFRIASNSGHPKGFALVSRYSRPDDNMLTKSFGTVWSCLPGNRLEVIPVESIVSVVAMIPHPSRQAELQGRLFVVEKMGLDIFFLGSIQAEDPNVDVDDNDDL
ncbi:hypothetical protein BC629DRAFT_1448272 [Irpex lacteus]|nr:hypothetical protein BC629DRAFT_1448272 [Irpex lacteus]